MKLDLDVISHLIMNKQVNKNKLQVNWNRMIGMLGMKMKNIKNKLKCWTIK